MKVIFIDDEAITLQLLEKVIDWGKYGIEVVGKAYDGEEGLRLFDETQPDIVISDIKMPQMSGLDFTAEIRKRDMRVKIILLSAYGEFEYAQKAISAGVSEYLLKPLDEDQLEEVVERLAVELKNEKRQKLECRNNQLEIKMRQEYLDFLRDKKIEIQNKLDIASELEVYGECICILENYALNRDKAEIPHPELVELIEECIDGKCLILTIYPGEILVVMEKEADAGREMYESLKKQGWETRVGFTPLDQCAVFTSLENAREAAEYTLWADQAVLSYREIGIIGMGNQENMETWSSVINEFINNADGERVIEGLRVLINKAKERYVNPRKLYEMIQDVLISIKLEIVRMYPETELAREALRHSDYYRMRACKDCESLMVYLESRIGRLTEEMRVLGGESGAEIVLQAKKYVLENYHRTDFTLQETADRVKLSKNYFSTVFHEVTGLKFWDYVTSIRIEKAREFLTGSDMTLAQISQAIGYETETYFSRKFKQIVGMTPGTYRKKR